jgi:hypothetical protein
VKAPKEGDIVKACLHLLTLRRCFAWRQNSGAMAGEYKGRKRFVRFVSTEADGISDIVGVLPDGTFLAVEVKKPGARTAKDRAERQAAFRARVAGKGGLALVVSDVAQLDEALRLDGY